MLTVQSNRINVEYITDPYDDSNNTAKWPVLFINKKLCKLKAIKGIRPKYFHKKDFVIKINDENGIHTVGGIKKIYNKIKKNGDDKYFPKILAFDPKNKFIVQEFVPLTTRGIKQVHRQLVNELSEKYDLDDVSTNKIWNWALNAKTKQVVIYDFVA